MIEGIDEHGRLTLTLEILVGRAQKNSAARMAGTPSDLDHDMVLQLVMTSPLAVLPDEGEVVPLFVREEQLYVAGLVEERRQSGGKAVICIGSPGIGKSFSLLFLMHMYVRAGKTVVFESMELKCMSMWVFSGEHKEGGFGANDLEKTHPGALQPQHYLPVRPGANRLGDRGPGAPGPRLSDCSSVIQRGALRSNNQRSRCGSDLYDIVDHRRGNPPGW